MRTGAVEHNSAVLIAVQEGSMRHLLAVVAAAMAMAAIGPVAAQVPPLATPQPWQPATTYPGAYSPYPFAAPTPSDAYRQGLISRWQLEQLEGPIPQALQGPNPNGSRQFD